MTRIKKLSLMTGLKTSEVRCARFISPQDIQDIMLKTAEAIQLPNAFNSQSMSLDANGTSCDVFSSEATQHDLLGWILKLSFQHWQHLTARKDIGNVVSMYIDSHIRSISNNELRLILLSETGPEYASRYLIQAAQRLDSTKLPPLFRYSPDWESEEDRKRRLEKAAARKTKKEAEANH